MTRAEGRPPGARPGETGDAPGKRPRRSRDGREAPPAAKGRVDVAGSAGKLTIVLVLVVGVGIVAYDMLRGGGRGTLVNVIEPQTLSTLASTGKSLFEAHCASCHGPKANGTNHGPPFVNAIYNPGHHPDEAFLLAAKIGVRAHHWHFGNMPRNTGVSDSDVLAIVRFIRELQEANGIRFQPHVM